MIKPKLKERIEIAKKLKPYKNKENIKRDSCNTIKECVKQMKIKAEVRLVRFDERPSYEEMPKDKDSGKTSLIFIQFSDDGYIVVVGAGEDIGFSTKSTTGKILKETGHGWDRESLVIVLADDLDSVAVSKSGSLFKARNAVEHCIGEYLYANGFPILNLWSHRNFTSEGWKKLTNNM